MLKTKTILAVTMAALAITMGAHDAEAHCQVPCGIYDDGGRITAMKEDATTIAKAIVQINELAGKTDAQSQNQLIRWVHNKETHASNIIEVISVYFLAQRVKPGDDQNAYHQKLAEHHAVIVAAMKTKQSSDDATVAALNEAIDTIAKYYHNH